MKRFVQRSRSSFNSHAQNIATMAFSTLGLIVFGGCATIDTGERIQKVMSANCSLWDKTYAEMPVTQRVPRFPLPNEVGVRKIQLAWNVDRPVDLLVEAMKRVTYHGRDLAPLDVDQNIPLGIKVCELTPDQQDKLRRMWTSRIVLALTTKYYDTSRELLEQGLDKGDLVIYYFLVGRNNSPEMGHADMVEMLCLNSNGQLVSRVNKRYGTSYPLGFVDRKGELSDVLF